MRPVRRIFPVILMGATMSLLALAMPAATLADSAPANATVTITDSGVNPAVVAITAGGTVTWTNSGNNVHTTTTPPGSGLVWDSGGLGNGQSFSLNFPNAGSFGYTSYTDCLNGNTNANFNCGGFVVNVVAPGAAIPGPAPAATPAPASAAPSAASSSNTSLAPAVITFLEGTGFSPSNLSVKVGQTITIVNLGPNGVHAFVTDLGVSPSFDTGGMDPGKQYNFAYQVPGVFTYHTATDTTTTVDASGNNVTVFSYTGTITVTR